MEKYKVRILEEVTTFGGGNRLADRGDQGEVIKFTAEGKFHYALVKIRNKFVSVPIEWIEEIN